MPTKNIITNQHVSAELQARAKEMRREMTPTESKLWSRLRANRLEGFHFRRQQVIGRYIADFYCHQVGLVVEVDGGIHLAQKAYDAQRDEAMRELGLRILRFSNAEVNTHLADVLTQILAACRDQAGTGDAD